jgi:hypothetical protein
MKLIKDNKGKGCKDCDLWHDTKACTGTHQQKVECHGEGPECKGWYFKNDSK